MDLAAEATPGALSVGPFELRYRDYGDPAAPMTVLLHGVYAGATSYEWRRLVPVLATDRCVRVPDLLGAGASDRPDLDWDATRFTAMIAAVLHAMPAGATIVASSLTAAHVVAAVAQGAPAAALALITPTGMGRSATAPAWTYAALRHSPVGDLFIRALSSGPSIAWFQRNKTYADPAAFDEDERIATQAAARLPNAKHLQLAFVLGRLWISLTDDMVRTTTPSVLWGSGQKFTPNAQADDWAQAGARVQRVAAGLPHVEDPEATVAWIRALPIR